MCSWVRVHFMPCILRVQEGQGDYLRFSRVFDLC